jgi:hypothetical protein
VHGFESTVYIEAPCLRLIIYLGYSYLLTGDLRSGFRVQGSGFRV